MNFKSWLKEKERPPKILWLTGMNSSGSKPKKLASLGYEVKTVGTITNYFAAYLGRLKDYHPFKLLRKTADIKGIEHIKNNIEKHDEEVKNFMPDIVIGTSQGGAVAMKLGYRYPRSKFILGCPAWKIFNSKPEGLPVDTVVIHGKKDIVVPIDDSMQLTRDYGYKLKVHNFGHEVPLAAIKTEIDQFLIELGIRVPAPIPTPTPSE